MDSKPRPTVADVDALGAALKLTAPPEFEDGNGHVNVCHYYRLHMEGAESAMAGLGFGTDYIDRTGHSIFSIEHHIRFYDESLVGDELSVHLRLLDVGPKTLHGMTIIVNRTRGTIANTLEYIELHVDLTTRRTAPMDDEMLRRLRGEVERHRDLPWSLPLSGPMGVR